VAKAEDCKSFIPGSSPGAASTPHPSAFATQRGGTTGVDTPTTGFRGPDPAGRPVYAPPNPKHEARNSKQIPIIEIPSSAFHYQDRKPPDTEQPPGRWVEAVFGTLEHSDFEPVSNFEIRYSDLTVSRSQAIRPTATAVASSQPPSSKRQNSS
jgi:hypothetical protein